MIAACKKDPTLNRPNENPELAHLPEAHQYYVLTMDGEEEEHARVPHKGVNVSERWNRVIRITKRAI